MMAENITDMEALAQAMAAFTKTTQTMEEAYRRLEQQASAMDRELASKNRELAMTSDYLGNLLESISDGCIAIDTEGVITRYNRAAKTILGYRREEVAGRPFREIFGRDFAAPRLPGSYELRTKSGRPVPVSERDSPIAGPDGRKLGMVKTFQDLSELIALKEQVRQIDRLAAVGEMAATVAHEIRNPLGGIRGFASFLSQDIPEDDPRRWLVDKILEGASSLERVVTELLEYTRPVELTLRPVSCRVMASAALTYLEYDRERFQVREDVPGDLKALADPEKVRQVLLNLLLNAVQCMDRGEIVLQARARNGQICIAVSDTGCGMDESQCEKVFSPFFTTKEKGTGLGLAISQKIVEGHGGHITVASTVGAGSTFTVHLPQAE